MGKLGNTLAMLKILESGRKYTVSELAKKIEVSPRMIKTYKNELEKAGIYIDSISGIYGGYIYNLKNNYDVSFNINDVNVLEKVYVKLPSDEQKELEILLEKIKTIVIYSDDKKEIRNIDANEQKRNYKIVSNAIKKNIEISFYYKKKTIILLPHNLSFYKNFIYVTGYSKLDKDLRTYNLNEIIFK